jgi:hypothetical protein
MLGWGCGEVAGQVRNVAGLGAGPVKLASQQGTVGSVPLLWLIFVAHPLKGRRSH